MKKLQKAQKCEKGEVTNMPVVHKIVTDRWHNSVSFSYYNRAATYDHNESHSNSMEEILSFRAGSDGFLHA